MDLTDSGWGIMADSCEHDDKCEVHKSRKLFEWFNGHQLPKEDPLQWNLVGLYMVRKITLAYIS